MENFEWKILQKNLSFPFFLKLQSEASEEVF